MELKITETAPTMTIRRRVVQFSEEDLIEILSSYCNSKGMEVSSGCELRVFGLDYDCSGLSLIING